MRDSDRPNGRVPPELFAFRPWMLAVAVLLACALGIAVMEELRAPKIMWAQASTAAEVRP